MFVVFAVFVFCILYFQLYLCLSFVLCADAVAADSSAGGQRVCLLYLYFVFSIFNCICVLHLYISFVFCALAGARYDCSRFKCWWSEGVQRMQANPS